MAGSIDNLNFEIILKDDEFGKRVQENMKLAKELNVSLTALLDLQNKVKNTGIKTTTQGINEAIKLERLAAATAKRATAEEKLTAAQTATKTAAEKLATAAAKRAAAEQSASAATSSAVKGQKAMLRAVNETNKAYQNQGRVLGELKSIALQYLSIRGVSEMISSLVRVTGEFELQKTTLTAMLGDLNSAEQVLTKIKGLAVESPFQFKELTTYAKQLTAFAVPAEQLFETTKMLADVSAGLGVGMDRLVLAYGQVKSAAFLRGQEVRQFTEAGIPILNELAKQFEKLEGKAISAGEVFDRISKRMVSFEMVNQIFKEMTSEGGKFFNMQEVQAETLKGKISNLKDAYEMMMNEIGEGQTENLKNAVDWIRRQIKNYEEIGKIITELIVTYGAYKAALLAISIATDTFRIANSKLLSSIIGVTKWMINNPYTVIAATLTAAGYAIYKYVTALESYERVHQAFLNTKEEYEASLVSESVKLDTLYAKLKLAKEGTDEYNEAKKQIYSQYASYISELREEGVEVENLVTLYDSLKGKVEAYTKAKFRSIAETELSETFNQEVKTIRDRYKQLVSYIDNLRKNAGEKALSAMDKEGLWQYITGDIATLFDMAENPALNEIKRMLASKILPFGRMAKDLQKELSTIRKTYENDIGAILELYGEAEEQIVDENPFKQPLGGDKDGGKSQAQKDLEIQIDLVKKLQRAYESLRPYVDDKTMRDTLSKYFPTAKKDWIESLDFTTILKSLADELAKYDKDASERLRYSIGTFGVDAEVERFRELEQTYKEASKSAEDYFKTLREWQAEDFNIEGSGIGYDINKIVSDLTTALNKIELKATKLKETFNQIIPSDFKEQIKQRIGEQVEIDAVVSLADKFGIEKPLLDALEKIDKNDISAIYKVLSESLGEEMAEEMIVSSMPAINTIKADFTKEFGADAWDAFWRNFLTDGSKAIDRLAQKEKTYEKKKAQEGLNDLAQRYVRDSTSNLNMSDWGDKTLKQINIIQEALRNLLEGDFVIDENTLLSLQKLGLTTDDLTKKIKELIGGKYNDTVTEKFKKIQSIAKKALSTFGTIGNSFEAIGEGIGAEALSDAGKYLSVAGEILDTIAECDAMWETIGDSAALAADATSEVANSAGSLASSLSWIEMVIKVVLIVVEQIANAVGRANAAQRQMIESTLHYNEVMNEYAQQKHDTIFGKNYFGGLINSAEAANTALQSLENAFKDLLRAEVMSSSGNVTALTTLKQLWWQLEDMGALSPDATFIDFARALKANQEEILAARRNTEGYKVSAGLAQDIETLLKFLDEYEKAMEDFKSRVRDLFGEMGNDIASNMIDAFLETENALGNLEKSFQSLGRSILESLLSSMIIDQILSKYEDRIAEMMLMYGAGETGPDMFDSLASDMQKDFESYGEFWNNLISAWQDAGLLGAEEAGNTLADGIKGITEDTANLLASYLNAIRADISYSKTLWERMDKSTQAIASALAGFSAPSLMEYQAQIAANTFNTAMHTQEIMLGLRSVITADGGLSAIRVLQY